MVSKKQSKENERTFTKRDAEIFGMLKTRQEVLEEIERDPEVSRGYQELTPELRAEFVEFCMGVRGMKVTYDPVFKKVFSPVTHSERLEDFLSLCLGQKLTIVHTLPNESERITEGGSLLVMDILVQLEDGSYVNVEIQRMGYLFPGARCACYSSDLVMRQYTQARARSGKMFTYRDIKRVYSIVLIQKSTEEFHRLPDEYLHHAKQVFDTGLEMDLVQEYLMIPLDIQKKCCQNRGISNKLDAWLYFISSESPEDIREVIEAYPEFSEIYREVFRFRYQMKELMSMYSEALKILDANTVNLMVELQQQKIAEQSAQLKEQGVQLREQGAQIKEQQKQIAELKALLAEKTV